jgi:hypothetical protein
MKIKMNETKNHSLAGIFLAGNYFWRENFWRKNFWRENFWRVIFGGKTRIKIFSNPF